MTCNRFDTALADYITGRLSAEHAACMESHADACVECSTLLQRERAITRDFAILREGPSTTDLWPRVRTAIQVEAAPRSRPLVRLRWVFASSVGAFAVAAAMLVATLGPTRTPANQPATASEVRPVVQLASELDPLPDPDREGAFRGSEAREVLFGTGR